MANNPLLRQPILFSLANWQIARPSMLSFLLWSASFQMNDTEPPSEGSVLSDVYEYGESLKTFLETERGLEAAEVDGLGLWNPKASEADESSDLRVLARAYHT